MWVGQIGRGALRSSHRWSGLLVPGRSGHGAFAGGVPDMGDNKESSVLFSLRELMSLEQDRVASERAANERRVQEAQQRRLADERAKSEAEAQKVRDIEESRLAGEQREREAAARLEAISLAELARAKAEVEHEAQLRELTARRGHEAQLVAIHQQSSTRRTKIGATVAIGILVLGMLGLGWKWRADQQAANLARANDAAALAQLEDEKAKLQQQIDAAQAESQRLQEALGSTKSAEEAIKLKAARDRVTRRLATLQEKQKSPKATRSGVPTSSKTPNCTCTEGDPLCGCLR
jgi:colicin import membrane protein